MPGSARQRDKIAPCSEIKLLFSASVAWTCNMKEVIVS